MNIKNFSVVTIVAAVLVSTTTVFVGTFAVADFLSTKNEEQTQLRTDLENDTEQLASGLTLPVWNFDLPQIMKIIESQMLEKNISDIVVRAGDQVYSMGRNAQWKAIITDGTLSGNDLLSEGREITIGGVKIGSVKIYMSRQFIEQALKRTIWNRAIAIILLDIILVLSLYLLLWGIVLNPLRKIKQYTLALNFENGNNQTLQNYHFHGELENVRHSIYTMVSLVESHYKEYLKLSRAVEHGPASVVITNRDGDIEYVNQKFCDLTGYSKEEAQGKNPKILNSGHHDKKFYEELWNTILAGNNWSGEMLNKKKNGDLFWEAALISPLINSKGEIINFVAVKDDISEKKNMVSALIKAKEKAESVNKLKDAFIANMSHEIRTPLNGILGMASLIRDIFPGKINKEDEELFNGIEGSSKRIIRTVDMILNYSRIQVGEFSTFRKNINISSICVNLVKEYSVPAKLKSLELTFINYRTDIEILADEYSVTMAISNIIDNAVKFTKHGSIFVILHKKDNGDIILDIKDTGIGISEEYLSNIFEPYHQEQMGYGRTYEGIGLALSLVKKVLALDNAIISVESKKGEGTTFSINFGKELLTEEKMIEKDKIIISPSLKEKTEPRIVLIVEDDTLNQLTTKKFIESKYSPIITDSSEDALRIVKENKVDIILMDISIRGKLNGLELTKILKSTKEYSHIPILAVTAHALEEDRQNALEAGCDSFLTKPFSRASLLEMISVLLQQNDNKYYGGVK
ncbi:MAG: response regulator [Ignavibacteriaceae bacterium]|nr:response regulator [Ignavibacteriaceae bacterium]